MQKIEHIGIAVKDLESSESLFSKLLQTNVYKRETVTSQNVITSFLKNGPNKIEMIQDLEAGGVINKFIEKKGEGVHHIAFSVNDIYSEMNRLREAGFQLLQEEPSVGADNKLVCFIHPKTANGILIELCQEQHND